MLELLLLLPVVMVSILSMTFEVSVDELSNARRGHYFHYDAHSGDSYGFLHEKVHEFYTRVLDGIETEIDGPIRTDSSGKRRACNIGKIQNMHRRSLCNKPQKRCVRIELPRNSVVSSMPECVTVDRCEGVCPAFRQCSPVEVEQITIPVIYLNLVLSESGPGLTPECTTTTVEKHLKCGCSCAVTEEDCDSNQIFNPATCRCECHNSQSAEICKKSGKHWDAKTCKCECPPDISQVCSTGAYFQHDLCRCVPTQERKWRPPV